MQERASVFACVHVWCDRVCMHIPSPHPGNSAANLVCMLFSPRTHVHLPIYACIYTQTTASALKSAFQKYNLKCICPSIQTLFFPHLTFSFTSLLYKGSVPAEMLYFINIHLFCEQQTLAYFSSFPLSPSPTSSYGGDDGTLASGQMMRLDAQLAYALQTFLCVCSLSVLILSKCQWVRGRFYTYY